MPIVKGAETGERVRNLAGGKIEAHSTLLADRGKPGATETIAPRARCEGLVSIVAPPVSIVELFSITPYEGVPRGVLTEEKYPAKVESH